jgi:uncharacterized membrane protein
MSDPRKFFTEREQAEIEEAIAEAEDLTSGEIRVHLDSVSGDDPAARARLVFERIGMGGTKQRNGVLLYIAVDDGCFVVLGDDGIDRMVPEDFWDHIKDGVEQSFRSGNALDGVFYFIEEAGERLAEYFPHAKRDINELPAGLSFGDAL